MSEPLDVVFERRAAREAEDIEIWWRGNRPAAPDLFVTELRRMLSIIAVAPGLGAPARDARLAGVRRVLLLRTRYHVYYRVNGQVLQILALWHASRGTEPDL